MRVPRHRLRVVAGGHGDHATGFLVRTEQGEAVGGAADLTLSFLVPASAELRAVALLTDLDTAPVLLPLSKQ